MAVPVGTTVASWRRAAGVGVRGMVAETLEFDPHPVPVTATRKPTTLSPTVKRETAVLFMR
jgi:hypothetical protein